MIPYIIKSILCLALLLAFYHLVLERERMHVFNRFYLIGSAIFSLLAPLYIIYKKVSYIAVPKVVSTGEVISTTTNTVIEEPFNFTPYIIGLYALISLLLLFRFSRNLWKITQSIRKNKHIPYKSARIVLLEKSTIPHSFLKYIFVYKADYTSQKIKEEVLTHEITHIRQKHSLDILFVEILQIVFWYNPLWVFLKKAIKLNHEFLADRKVIKTYQNITKYQYLLLESSTYNFKNTLTSNLNYLLTKKRLEMMRKTSSKTVILIKKLAILPLLISAVFLFAQRVEAQEKPTQEKKPLTVVDGKIIPNTLSKQINPENIESVSVLKGKAATKVYGDKGKNGVIEITTKNKVETGFKSVNGENVYFMKKNGNITYYNRFGQEVEIKDGKTTVLKEQKKNNHKSNAGSKMINGEVVFFLKRENGDTLHFNRYGQTVKIKNDKVVVLKNQNKEKTDSNKKSNADYKIVNGEVVFSLKRENGEILQFNRYGEKVEIKDGKVVVLSDENKKAEIEKSKKLLLKEKEKLEREKEILLKEKEELEKEKEIMLKEKKITPPPPFKQKAVSPPPPPSFNSKKASPPPPPIPPRVVVENFLEGKDITNKLAKKNLLTMVNGKEISQENLKKIHQNSIKKIKILKGKSAVDKYGDKGKNGVVIVETKK